jgi:hypothetical protein
MLVTAFDPPTLSYNQQISLLPSVSEQSTRLL